MGLGFGNQYLFVIGWFSPFLGVIRQEIVLSSKLPTAGSYLLRQGLFYPVLLRVGRFQLSLESQDGTVLYMM
jgi:hypothetical protein